MARALASVTVQLEPGFERAAMAAAFPAMEAGARIVAEGQRQRIPVSRDGSHGRPSGYARSKIHIERGADGLGPYWDVGTGDDALSPDGTNYPVILELGSRPHVIESHGDYPLRDKYGHVFGRRVQHPGTHPYPWCRAALADIAGRVLP
jgi:hypothetical protein